MATQTIDFKRLNEMPSSGLVTGTLYFINSTGMINIATGATTYKTFGPIITRHLTSGKKIASIKMGDTTHDLYCEQTEITDSVTTTSSVIAASATAVKTAYDLAKSKTANTGTVTSIATGTGLTGGTITGTGTISINSDYQTYISNGNTAYSYFTNGVAKSAARLSTVSKTVWGQTFWNANGVPQDVTGALSSVTDITMTGAIKMGDATISYDSTQKCIKFSF